MLNILFTIVNFIILFCTGCFIFKIIENFLSPRSRNRIIRFLIITALMYIFNITIFPEEVDGALGLFLCFFLLLLIFYRGSLILKLSVLLLLYPIGVSIGYLSEDAGYLIWYHIFNKDMTDAGQTILHTATVLLRLPLWYLIYRLTKSWITSLSQILTFRMWLVIDTISLTSFIGIITVIYHTDPHASYMAYPSCLSAILTSLGCCYLCSYIARSIQTDMEIRTLRYQQDYYKELVANEQTIRRLRHDMNNHLSIIGTLFNQNKAKEAKEYFRSLSEEFSAPPMVFCKDNTINALLSAKYHLAVQNDIDCVFQVELGEFMFLNTLSICSLIANTLDNAIEANLKIANTSYRKLCLKARYKDHYLSYELTNAKINQIRQSHDRYLSDKEDSTAHGIGLQNVKTIIERNGGTLSISFTDTSFTVTALLHDHG